MRMKGRNVDYATVKLLHNEEARPSKDIKAKMGHTNKVKNFVLQ